MKIVSWNCKDGLNEDKVNKIRELDSNIDIFVIQECRKADIYNFKDSWKFINWYGDDMEYSDLGIAIFSKNYEIKYFDEFNRNFRYVIPYKILTKNEAINLFAVWTKPLDYYYDENVTKAIQWYRSKGLLSGYTIIIGDFNTGASDEHKERYNNLCKNLSGFKNCAEINGEKLRETFCSNRNKLYINDFSFITEDYLSSFKEMKIFDEEWQKRPYGQSWNGLSDHCPILVEFNL